MHFCFRVATLPNPFLQSPHWCIRVNTLLLDNMLACAQLGCPQAATRPARHQPGPPPARPIAAPPGPSAGSPGPSLPPHPPWLVSTDPPPVTQLHNKEAMDLASTSSACTSCMLPSACERERERAGERSREKMREKIELDEGDLRVHLLHTALPLRERTREEREGGRERSVLWLMGIKGGSCMRVCVYARAIARAHSLVLNRIREAPSLHNTTPAGPLPGRAVTEPAVKRQRRRRKERKERERRERKVSERASIRNLSNICDICTSRPVVPTPSRRRLLRLRRLNVEKEGTCLHKVLAAGASASDNPI